MPRPKLHDDALRIRLLDTAGAVLTAEGPDALSLRRLAAEAGTSNSVVYSLFGGKPGVLRALFVEAFPRFGLAAATRHVPIGAGTGSARARLSRRGTGDQALPG